MPAAQSYWENAGRSILLLEAGQDYADPQMLPETVRDGG